MVIGANRAAIIYEIGVVGRCAGAGRRPRRESPRRVFGVMRMPRTVQEILDHADDLAKRFEDYEPAADDERNPHVFAALRKAVVSPARPASLSHTALASGRVRHWLTLGVPPPSDAANEIERLRFVRNLSIRSLLLFGPIMTALFLVFAVPPWGFGVLTTAYLFQAVSIMRLTQRIREAERTQ